MLDPESLRLVNITADACALAVIGVLLTSIRTGTVHWKRRLLLSGALMHGFSVVGYLLVAYYEHRLGSVEHGLLVIGVYLMMLFSLLTNMTIMVYVYTDVIATPTLVAGNDIFVMLVWACGILNLVMVLANPFTHAYMTIDANNALVFGPAYWLNDFFYTVQSILIIPIVIFRSRKNGLQTTLRLLICGCVAISSSVLNIRWPNIDATPFSSAIVLALLSVGVQDRLEEDLAQARTEAAESRVRMLSGQIHPHFIFNSLNAIKALVVEDPALAEQAIQDFSDYLRSHLDTMSSSRLVPFSSEMDHVRHYVSLEMADPVCPLEVVYQMGATEFLIPPLTIQPLVENAIRHGVRTRQGGGKVVVESHETADAFVVSVRDMGRGESSVTKRQVQRRHVGIENVRERLEKQCSGTLEAHSVPQGTLATVKIPKADAK